MSLQWGWIHLEKAVDPYNVCTVSTLRTDQNESSIHMQWLYGYCTKSEWMVSVPRVWSASRSVQVGSEVVLVMEDPCSVQVPFPFCSDIPRLWSLFSAEASKMGGAQICTFTPINAKSKFFFIYKGAEKRKKTLGFTSMLFHAWDVNEFLEVDLPNIAIGIKDGLFSLCKYYASHASLK